MFRSRLKALAMVIATLAAAAIAPAGAGAAGRVPAQGIYQECPSAAVAQCAAQLSMIGRAGFTRALNYTIWAGSPAQILTLAATAQRDHVKLIWPLNAPAWRGQRSLTATYPQLAAGCGCQTNAQMIDYAISLVRSLPATWGYYIGDELPSSDVPAVASLAAQVRVLDPGHGLLYTGTAWPSVAQSLNPFMTAASALGADIYPVGWDAPLSSVKSTATAVMSLTRRHHRAGVVVLQTFDWSQYQQTPGGGGWPTSAQMRTMRNLAIGADPSMVLWYNLSDIERSADPQAHWRALTKAAFGKSAPSARASRAHRGRARRRRRRHRG
jgi:hypothetical protein